MADSSKAMKLTRDDLQARQRRSPYPMPELATAARLWPISSRIC